MNRHGAALLIAIAAVAVLGMISLTGMALARAERHAGLAAIAEAQSRGVAEAALVEAMVGWPASSTPTVPGAETALASLVVPGPASGQAWVRSLGGPVFAIRSRGVRRDGAGVAIAQVDLELLVLVDSLGPDSLIHPRKYPLGWRLLP